MSKNNFRRMKHMSEPMMSMCITSTESFTDPKMGALVPDSQATTLNNNSQGGGVLTEVDADEGKGGGLRVTPLQDPSLSQHTGPPIDNDSGSDQDDQPPLTGPPIGSESEHGDQPPLDEETNVEELTKNLNIVVDETSEAQGFYLKHRSEEDAMVDFYKDNANPKLNFTGLPSNVTIKMLDDSFHLVKRVKLLLRKH